MFVKCQAFDKLSTLLEEEEEEKSSISMTSGSRFAVLGGPFDCCSVHS